MTKDTLSLTNFLPYNLTIVGKKEYNKRKWWYPAKCACGNPKSKLVRVDYLIGTENVKTKGCGKCSEFDFSTNKKKFGRWTVESFAGRNKRGESTYHMVCECGGTGVVERSRLTGGHSLSCGCQTAERAREINSGNLIGQTFGRLTAIEKAGTDKNNNIMYKCKCSCSKEVVVRGFSLSSMSTRSCGCLLLEGSRQSQKTMAANKIIKTDKELIGKTFGRLTVIKRTEERATNNDILFEVHCSCGNVLKLPSNRIKTIKSCGCKQKDDMREAWLKENIGKKFGRLTILKKTSDKNAKEIRVQCICECGVIKDYLFHSLAGKRKHTTSCGCYHREICSGKNHWNYNHNMTEEERAAIISIRDAPEYLRWRRDIYKKYDRTCQICGDKENPEAHHLYSITEYIEKATDIDNGIVMCVDCHSELHCWWGIRNPTTPEVYDQFKKDYEKPLTPDKQSV